MSDAPRRCRPPQTADELFRLLLDLPPDEQTRFLNLVGTTHAEAVFWDMAARVEKVLRLLKGANDNFTRLESAAYERWHRTHRQASPATLSAAEQIQRQRAMGWTWARIDRHHKKANGWARRLLSRLNS
jgi:hypothetical protein